MYEDRTRSFYCKTNAFARLSLLFSVLVACQFSGQVIAGEVVDVETRATTIRLLIEGPAHPSAVIALFMGGDGNAEITDQGEVGKGQSNFAITTRGQFQAKGIATVVVAAPLDMGAKLTRLRGSDDYATDFGNVMKYLHERFKTPVWVHGTSRGTISIALPASKIKELLKSPDGIILSSSVTDSNRQSKNAFDNVLDANLENISVPVFIVANSNDACSVTPASGAARIAQAMKHAKPVKVKIFDGPDGVAKGDPCGPNHHHGFPGIRKEVLESMIEFMNKPQ
jgi:pimeloyl-ACP methyl ester carboxylesterase